MVTFSHESDTKRMFYFGLMLAGAFSGCIQPLQTDLSWLPTKGVSDYCLLIYFINFFRRCECVEILA